MNSQFLLEAIVDTRFAGAACAGDHDLFDPRAEGEEIAQHRERAALARTICGVCPILTRCADLTRDMSRRDRGGFTYAGTTYSTTGDPIQPARCAPTDTAGDTPR